MGLHKNYKLSSFNNNEVKFNSVFKQFVSDPRISMSASAPSFSNSGASHQLSKL